MLQVAHIHDVDPLNSRLLRIDLESLKPQRMSPDAHPDALGAGQIAEILDVRGQPEPDLGKRTLCLARGGRLCELQQHDGDAGAG
jgi:hypothetical protein